MRPYKPAGPCLAALGQLHARGIIVDFGKSVIGKLIDDIPIKLYVNGNVEASNSYVGKVPVSLQGHKYLGSSGPSYTDYFNGDLDEVEIYNRALSDSEIQGIFNGSTGKCTVAIDIKPGSYPNSINPKSKGKIPVAILSTKDFNAPKMVDRDSLTFGSTGDESSLAFCNPKGEDINRDRLKDLVCHFYTEDTGFLCGDTEGILKGKTKDGTPIEGRDSVRINPCKK